MRPGKIKQLRYYASGWFTFKSSPPSDAYMCQGTGSALVQIMACCLFGVKPLSKPMLCKCQLDPQDQTSLKSGSKYRNFHWRKRIWNDRLRNGGDFVQRRWIKSCQKIWLMPSLHSKWKCSGKVMAMFACRWSCDAPLRPSHWRHNERDGVSSHGYLDYLLNLLFSCTSKKTPKLRVTGLCEGNPQVTGGFLS